MSAGRRLPARAAALAVAFGLAVGAVPAGAWDNQGHMATGAIAYDALARSHPELVARIVALMRAHPDRARFDRELGPAAGAARDRLLFEYMARWPDDARRGPFDRPDWHYQVQVVAPVGAVLPFHSGRAGDAFLRNLALARDAKAPAADRAVALCWVMHLVGDMHMPLHAGHWLSPTFPLTDRAGTTAFVRDAASAKPDELHLVWDRAADQGPDERAGAQAAAARGEALVPPGSLAPSPPEPRARFDAWSASSRRLALDVAYDGGRFEGAPAGRPAPVLSPAYLDRMHATAQRRIGEAGQRLAEVLELVPAA